MFTPSVDKAQEEAKVIQKTVTKNGVGYAPKIEPVITEVKKVSTKVEVKTEKVTKASLIFKPIAALVAYGAIAYGAWTIYKSE